MLQMYKYSLDIAVVNVIIWLWTIRKIFFRVFGINEYMSV